jgi:hypothetical protein
MSEMLNIELHTHGTTRFALCFGRYAVKFARGSRGRAANRAENVEWERATPERREMLCPMLWASPFGLFNLMQRAVQLTRTQQLALLERDGFPDWDYMPGAPSSPFEYKESDRGYVDGRLVALDYAVPVD